MRLCAPELADKYLDLLRVIRGGLDVKFAVDNAMELCSQIFDLHKAIESAKLCADEAIDERQKRKESVRGLHHLRQYFELIIFQAYLNVTPPDTWRDLETFENFVKERPGMHKLGYAHYLTSLKCLRRLRRSSMSMTRTP